MGTSWSGFVDRYLTPIATVVGSALVAVITVYCTKPVTPRFEFSGAPFVVTTTIVTTVTDSHPGSTAMADLTRQLEVERGRRESCEARLRRVSETPRRRLVGQSRPGFWVRCSQREGEFCDARDLLWWGFIVEEE